MTKEKLIQWRMPISASYIVALKPIKPTDHQGDRGTSRVESLWEDRVCAVECASKERRFWAYPRVCMDAGGRVVAIENRLSRYSSSLVRGEGRRRARRGGSDHGKRGHLWTGNQRELCSLSDQHDWPRGRDPEPTPVAKSAKTWPAMSKV